MKFHRICIVGVFSVLAALQETGSSATTTYSNRFTLYLASEGLPGEQVNISFNDYPYYTPLRNGEVVSNVTFFGNLITQYIAGAPFTFLNNYDNGVPLTLRFPTGARAFGAYLSSWLGPTYPKIIPMTATTDQGEVFSFDVFSASYASPMTNQTFFGLIPATPIYQITLSDGGIFNRPMYPTHEELIAQIFAVLNRPPTLDLTPSPTNQLDIGVNGAAGQTVVLLSSTNLTSWQPVVTNKLVADRWVYSVTQTNVDAARFYRVGAM